MRKISLQILLAATLVTGVARLAAAQDDVTGDALKAAREPSGEYDHWRNDLKARQDATVMFYKMGRQQLRELGSAGGPAHVWVYDPEAEKAKERAMHDAAVTQAKHIHLGNWIELIPGDRKSLFDMDTMPGRWSCDGPTIKYCVNLDAQPAAQR
jgi:hypothetical protein